MNDKIKFEDISGSPRSDNDVKEAIQATSSAMAKFTGDPGLMLLYPTIIESLNELLMLREVIRRAGAPDYAKQSEEPKS